MLVCKKMSFDAAHYLPNYFGDCSRMHGHRWVVEVAVSGEVGSSSGMVVDFKQLKGFLSTIKDLFDHQLLNKILLLPTAENLCLFVKEQFEAYDCYIGKLEFVRIWESEDSYAEVEGDHKEMTVMSFMPELKDFLKENGGIYTIRKYKYAPYKDRVIVPGIGICKRWFLREVAEKDDVEPYVSKSGFETVDAWWKKAKSFYSGYNGIFYLYEVEVEKEEEDAILA